MMSVQLLDKTRKINKLLHNNHSARVDFNDMCNVLSSILESNILVISKKGKVLGTGYYAGVEVINELVYDKVGGFVDEMLNERLLSVLFMYKSDSSYEIDDIILSEYGTTVVGLEMMRSVNEENAEEVRKKKIVRSAIDTLSTSELDAIKNIFKELNGNEGTLVASKIADNVGITRSVIVNALRKFESAGVIDCKSSGMKGTYIKVINEYVFDELSKYDE